jgi:hypothetical protein
LEGIILKKSIFTVCLLALTLAIPTVVGAESFNKDNVNTAQTLKEKTSIFYDELKMKAPKDKKGKINFKEFKLSDEDLKTSDELNKSIKQFVEENSPSSQIFSFQTASYDVNDYAKNIEASLNLNESSLTSSNIADAFADSIVARDAASAYAIEKGYGSTTWDNEADAFRHFTWNFLMTKHFTSTKARIIGNNHELALLGAKQYYQNPNLTYNEIVVYGTLYAQQMRYDTVEDKWTFNNQFDDASIMDISNNQIGRDYGNNSSYTNSQWRVAFDHALINSNNLVPTIFDVYYVTRDFAFSKWYF